MRRKIQHKNNEGSVQHTSSSALAALYTIISAAVVSGIYGIFLIYIFPSEQPLTQVLSLNAALVSLCCGIAFYGAIRGYPVLRVVFAGLVVAASLYSVLSGLQFIDIAITFGSGDLGPSMRWPLTSVVCLVGVCLLLGSSPRKRKVLWRVGGVIVCALMAIYFILLWFSDLYLWFGLHPMVVSLSVLFTFLFGVGLLLASYKVEPVLTMPSARALWVMWLSVSAICGLWYALSFSEVKRIEREMVRVTAEASMKRTIVANDNVNKIKRMVERWQFAAPSERETFARQDIVAYLQDLPQLHSVVVLNESQHLMFESFRTGSNGYFWILGSNDVIEQFNARPTSPVVMIPEESVRQGAPVILVRFPLVFANDRHDDASSLPNGSVVAVFNFAVLVEPAITANPDFLRTYASMERRYLLRSTGSETEVIDLKRTTPTSLYIHENNMELPYVGEANLFGVFTGDIALRQTANLHTVVISGGLLLSMFLVISIESGHLLRSQRWRLQQQATRDSLTGLINRTVLEDVLSGYCEKLSRSNHPIAVLFIDLDGFKPVNDSLGLVVGDAVLKETAGRLESCMREGSVVGRFGGDEFIVIVPNMGASEPISDLVSDILTRIAQPYTIASYRLYITASIGITTTLQSPPEPKQLIQHADMAMYQAKRQGRNHYHFYSNDISERFHTSVVLRNELQDVLERGALTLHYQPLFSCKTRKIIGVEALLRWQREDGSFVSPAEFIPLAEDTGQIIPISAWVLQQACTDGLTLQQFGDISVAVNLSAVQFNRANFIEALTHTLNLTGFPAQKLHLELTESVLMEDSVRAISVLNTLQQKKFHIAIDDFGTGFSSLSYLKRLPVGSLKIDRAFIRDVATDNHDAAITRSIITMAKELNLAVIAEGVETEEQVAFVESTGCDAMQGFYFAKPMPLDDLVVLLQKH